MKNRRKSVKFPPEPAAYVMREDKEQSGEESEVKSDDGESLCDEDEVGLVPGEGCRSSLHEDF